ncbi:MAG TPA: SDR family oxidoreductase [Gemmatimonadales bacterium]|nr:SDR family oxidoreductase [Gemmatimonadales bacterium]
MPQIGLAAGKVALVTGAGSGIGRAAAELFAEEGALGVAVSDIDADAAEDTAATLRRSGHQAIAVTGDVGDPAHAHHLVTVVLDRFGRVDAAVNNAGMRGPWGSILEVSDEEWDQVLTVNLSGVFYGMRAQIAAMRSAGGGAIVNVSSGAVADPHPHLAPYIASKFGVVGLTRSVAGQFPLENIRINAVLPGATRTGMWAAPRGGGPGGDENTTNLDRGRVAAPREVAEAIVWLCSDRASWMHGHEILVDGGSYAYKGGLAVGLPAALDRAPG